MSITRGHFKIQALPAESQRRILVTFVVLLVGVTVVNWYQSWPLCLFFKDMPFPFLAFIDSESYRDMALGDFSHVINPFSKRVLYPFLANALTSGQYLDLPSALVFLNLVSLGVMAYCVAACLELVIGNSLIAIPLLLTPFPLESLELAYLPDLFHMALTALFFLCLLKERVGWGLVVLWIAFTARESTVLLCVVCLVVGWWRRERTLALGSLAVIFLGTAATAPFVKLGQPNLHHLPDILYLPLKLAWNFLVNIFGVKIWSDVRAEVGTPIVTWQLPVWLHIGTDRVVGLCLNWKHPANTLITLATLFGVGPVLMARFLRNWRTAQALPTPLLIIGSYGLIAFILGTSLGDWTERLIGYGWPLFWIILPYLWRQHFHQFASRDLGLLIICYFIVAWWPRLVGYTRDSSHLLCLWVLVPYAITCWRMRSLRLCVKSIIP
jgi:hypothetical protein